MARGRASKNEASRLVNETLQERSLNGQTRNGSRFQGQGGQRTSPSAKPGQQVSRLAQIPVRGDTQAHPDDKLAGHAFVDDAVWRNGKAWVVKSISGRTFELTTLKSPFETIQVNV